MSLRHAIDSLDSDSSYATVLELREENRLMRGRRFLPKPTEHRPISSGVNDVEDAMIRALDSRRVFKRKKPRRDAEPPSHTRLRKP